LACAEINKFSPYGGVGAFDFNILTAFIRLGRARPVRGGVPSIIITIGLVLSILLLFAPEAPIYYIV